jgi:hypothetical protein
VPETKVESKKEVEVVVKEKKSTPITVRKVRNYEITEEWEY